MSSTSLPSSDQDQSDKAASSDVVDADDDDEYFEAEPLPILGKCKALYPFEGKFLGPWINHLQSQLKILLDFIYSH